MNGFYVYAQPILRKQIPALKALDSLQVHSLKSVLGSQNEFYKPWFTYLLISEGIRKITSCMLVIYHSGHNFLLVIDVL